MHVGQLLITRYDAPYAPGETDVVVHPTWEAIEAAIVRMERCLFPIVWLYPDPVAAESDLPHFEVVGGEGAYAVVFRAGKKELWLQNPQGGTELVDVWVSDQGASIPASMVCTSLGEVLRAARYFFEQGEAMPDSVWA